MQHRLHQTIMPFLALHVVLEAGIMGVQAGGAVHQSWPQGTQTHMTCNEGRASPGAP